MSPKMLQQGFLHRDITMRYQCLGTNSFPLTSMWITAFIRTIGNVNHQRESCFRGQFSKASAKFNKLLTPYPALNVCPLLDLGMELWDSVGEILDPLISIGVLSLGSVGPGVHPVFANGYRYILGPNFQTNFNKASIFVPLK